MKMPIIPLTDPEKQIEITGDFCSAWNGPIELECGEKSLVMMPYDYYLETFCTLEEAKMLDEEISATAKGGT